MSKLSKKQNTVKAGELGFGPVVVIPNNGAYWEKSGQAEWNWLIGVRDRFEYLRVAGAEVLFPRNPVVARAVKLGGAR